MLGQGCAQLGACAPCGEGDRPLRHSWELRATIVLQCNFKVVRDQAFDTFVCIYANVLQLMQIAIYWVFLTILAGMSDSGRHWTDFSLSCIFSSTLHVCTVNRSV